MNYFIHELWNLVRIQIHKREHNRKLHMWLVGIMITSLWIIIASIWIIIQVFFCNKSLLWCLQLSPRRQRVLEHGPQLNDLPPSYSMLSMREILPTPPSPPPYSAFITAWAYWFKGSDRVHSCFWFLANVVYYSMQYKITYLNCEWVRNVKLDMFSSFFNGLLDIFGTVVSTFSNLAGVDQNVTCFKLFSVVLDRYKMFMFDRCINHLSSKNKLFCSNGNKLTSSWLCATNLSS